MLTATPEEKAKVRSSKRAPLLIALIALGALLTAAVIAIIASSRNIQEQGAAETLWVRTHILTGTNRQAAHEGLQQRGIAYDEVATSPAELKVGNPDILIDLGGPISLTCGWHRYITIKFDVHQRVREVDITSARRVCI